MPQLDALGIIASDLAATLAFYRIVGVAFSEEGEGHMEAELGGGFRLMIDSVELVESFSTYESTSGGRNVSLAFRCESPAEVDEVHERAVAAGHRSKEAPFDAPWGQRYATLLDPDANPVDLYARL